MTANATTRKGFTLIEMLAAMTLMVAVASCLYSSLYTGFRAKRAAEAAIEPSTAAANAIEIIKRDIIGALPPSGILSGAFIGMDSIDGLGQDSDIVTLYTTHMHTANDRAVGGTCLVELLLEADADNGGSKLLRRVTTNLLSPRTVEPDEQVLSRSVESLNLRYFDGFSWLDEWDSTAHEDTLPQAVEIGLQITYKSRESAKQARPCKLIQSFLIPCGAPDSQEGRSGT